MTRPKYLDRDAGLYSFHSAADGPDAGDHDEDATTPEGASAGGPERRRAPRYGRVVYEASLYSDGDTEHDPVCVTDVSRLGAFVECIDELPPGGKLCLLMALNDRRRLRLEARVVRRVTLEQARTWGTSAGVGVEFIEVAPDARAKLESSLLEATERAVRRGAHAAGGSGNPGSFRAVSPFVVHRITDVTALPQAQRRVTALQLLTSARGFEDAGLMVRAVVTLEIALALDPDNVELRETFERANLRTRELRAIGALRQAEYAERTDNYGEALRHAEEATRFAPETSEYFRRAGELALAAGRRDVARRHFRAFRTLVPDAPGLDRLLASTPTAAVEASPGPAPEGRLRRAVRRMLGGRRDD